MKYRFLYFLILASVFGFQGIRTKNLESYFKINQEYNFTLPQAQNGNLKIDNPVNYLILSSSRNAGSKDILENLRTTLDFSKVLYDLYPMDTKEKLDIDSYEGIIVIAEDYSGLTRENYENILKSVKKGNTLFILQRSFRSPFNRIAGILKTGEFTETEGLKFKKQLFPGFSDLNLSGNILANSSLNLTLEKDVEITAVSDKGVPMIFKRDLEKGMIIYSNVTLFQGKIAQGLMKQLIAYGTPVSIMPMLNSKVIHIDDFPAPIPDHKNAVLQKEYGMGTKQFFEQIWWKDITAIGQRQKLKYSGFLIADYNDSTTLEKIKDISKNNFNDLSRLGRKLAESGGEIGVHGYNHNSLGVLGEINFSDYNYNPWESVEAMEKGLTYVRKNFKKIYGDGEKIYSYMAPSNLLTKTGKQAILAVFPNVKSISGIFYGEVEPGLLLQEVGRDKDYPELYAFPRFSSGFFNEDTMKWQIYNALASYGYVSHFIHPDDIIDKERGRGKSWDFLKKDFEEMFAQVNRNFPYLFPEVQSQLTYDYSKMEEIKFKYGVSENKVSVDVMGYRGSITAYMRLRKRKISSIEGGTYKVMQKTDEYTLYLLEIDSPQVKIGLGEENE